MRWRNGDGFGRMAGGLALLLLPLLLAGCTGLRPGSTPNNDERVWFSDPAFEKSGLQGKKLAVGGVLLRNGAPLDRFAGLEVPRFELTCDLQAELWSSSLDGALIALTPQTELEYWAGTIQRVDPEVVDATYGVYARRSLLKPDLLAHWAEALPGVDYLAFARIEDTWLDNTGQSPWARSAGMGRVVAVTLDIYDLKEGRSVWSGMNQRHQTEGRTPLREGDGSRSSGTDVDGTTVAAPTLQKGLTYALEEVVLQLKRSLPRGAAPSE